MIQPVVNIHIITNAIIKKPQAGFLYVCWIQNEINAIKINDDTYEHVSNAIIFLNQNLEWTLFNESAESSAGYILAIPPQLLNSPVLNKLHINELRLFNSTEIPIINLSPGIAKRTQAILEMIDELLGTQLNHKDEAILSLLNTFFVYCDGQCNIKSVISKNGSKSKVVYRFKKLVDKHLNERHEVADYATLMNISPKYLNECVKDVLGFTAKGIIAEQLLMRSRHQLKFSDQTIKEISYGLGFSSPEYFSAFFKNHTGATPSSLRKT
ncbi:MAG: AraC family transcriptional regulator [Winogradskyella sp.]|nr:AraC family transcriptional regulator [Winogradskyella sp.]